MKMPSKKNIDMTQGSILKQLSAFTIPLLIGEFFQLFYTLVDSITVGNFVGAGALAAIGASESIVNVVIGFFNGMAVGFGVVVARYFGAKDQEKLDLAVNSVLQLGVLLGLIMTAGGIVLCNPILHFMDTPPEILKDAQSYLMTYFAGIMGFVLYNTAASVLRAVGEVRIPLYCLLASSVVNVVLDLIMVILFHMGVAGVALATIASQWMATGISVFALFRRKELFHVSPFKVRPDRKMLSVFLQMGIPTGFQKTITSVSNVLVLSKIAFFGEACLAGWTVCNKIDHVFMLLMQAIGSALSTFVSQNLGAKQYERIEKGVRVSLAGGAVLYVILGTLIVLNRGMLVRAFGTDSEMYYYAVNFLFYLTIFKFAQLLMNVFAASLRGAGKMALVTLFMLSGIVVFRQIYLFFITRFMNNPWLVGLSYPAGQAFAAMILFLYYLFVIRPEWRKKEKELKELQG